MMKHGFDAERSSEHSFTPGSNLKYIHVHVRTDKRHGLGMSIPKLSDYPVHAQESDVTSCNFQ